MDKNTASVHKRFFVAATVFALGIAGWAGATAYSQGTDIADLKAHKDRDAEFRQEVIKRLDSIETLIRSK